jgi:hypothetical protein
MNNIKNYNPGFNKTSNISQNIELTTIRLKPIHTKAIAANLTHFNHCLYFASSQAAVNIINP